MTQRDMFPELLATPEKAEAQPAPQPPAPQQPAAVPAPASGDDDIHNPFSGITMDMAPVAAIMGEKDPFAAALRATDRGDEAKVDDDVYDRDVGEET